ncbi:MAG: hypothetical protein CMI16_10305 [Opitutaceae bacterium]|jgi:renalase|nr:hypothetical protein [Opitutaceae bacterium]
MSVSQNDDLDVLVIGAGMAGLTAAKELQTDGLRVAVVDKGRGVGGRMATRRFGDAVFDHGAQFITGRDNRFLKSLNDWETAGCAMEWCRGFDGNEDGHMRWRGAPGMTGIAKNIAAGLDVRLQHPITALKKRTGGWIAEIKDGVSLSARALIQTAPVPQALAMFDAGGWSPDAELRQRLQVITYERCLVGMALLKDSSKLPPPGGVSVKDGGPIAWLADNHQKGISNHPAITIHATPEYSLANWDRDRLEVAAELIEAAAPWIGCEVKEFKAHGWKFSRPIHTDECGCLVVNEAPAMIMAGDAFSAPRVEGAALSGWAAAGKLREMRGSS